MMNDDMKEECVTVCNATHCAAKPMVRRNLSVDTQGANDYPCTNMDVYLSSLMEAVVPNLTRRLHL